MTADNFYAEHLERMVQGYAEMAQIQVARDYVWERTNVLPDTDPLLWGRLPELGPARAKEIRNAGISR